MNPNDVVFPSTITAGLNGGMESSTQYGCGGISNRDFIALKFACAAIANPGTLNPWGSEFLLVESYKLADTFIEVSNRPQKA